MASQAKKQKKHGRGNRIGGQCKVYKLQNRRSRNKVFKLTRHIKRFGETDLIAVARLKHYKILAGIK